MVEGEKRLKQLPNLKIIFEKLRNVILHKYVNI